MTARIKATVFDAYGTLFDVYSVSALAERMFPGRGMDLTRLWRSKQIEYTQVRTLAGRHRPFWDITRDALIFSARRFGLELGEMGREQLMAQYAKLSAFPENPDALKEIKALGMPTAILSNGTPAMLDSAVKSAGMEGLFDHILSVETVRKYKTAPEAYRLATDAFECAPGEILFVSSNGWDVAGAIWFGFTTFWINRTGQPPEELGVEPTTTGSRLTDVVSFVKQLGACAA